MSALATVPVRSLTDAMNKTEAKRAEELELMKRGGYITAWWFEQWTFKLADDCRYTPDFVIQANDGALRVGEIKGFWRDDARVKVKLFAALFPFPVSVLTARAKKDGGGWKVEVLR